VACLQFINAIVSTPEDLEFRAHLRNEIMRAGMYDVIDVRNNLQYIFIV
jgi:hypothetical protein